MNSQSVHNVISVRGLAKRYGGVKALNGLDLDLAANKVHAIVGENGAGKSTLMNIASGTLRADSGSIEICGQAISSLTPHQATDLGLAIVHQHPAVLPDLTIEENIIVELKRPSVVIGSEQFQQVERYLRFIIEEERFNSLRRNWKFILFGKKV